MRTTATTADAYLDELPPERRGEISTVRDVILKHLPPGLVESIGYGMICYVVPADRAPKACKGQPFMLIGLASQKQYCSLHLMCLYMDAERQRWIRERFERAGKRLDMGKACVRFRRAEDLDLDTIAEVVASGTPERMLRALEASRSGSGPSSSARSGSGSKRSKPSGAKRPVRGRR